ncbi:MAG: 50S ribosome-binding GTPase [Dehalococcoidales bacterium]|nr:MAG: 50S ribosome-binding GTPase [Dehalococcoidales bacterium]
MPANLTPAYFEAEKRFRAAKTNQEKIIALEEMLAVMPKHKGTDHLKADLRRKIARLTQASERKSATQRASMVLPKEGAAQVVIVGLPNAGKSQLVASITKANPNVADYPFTTQNATPGMMEFENIKIQLIDMPPLVSGSVPFWVPPMLRRADTLLIMVDLNDNPLDQLIEISMQLEELRIGIGEKKLESEEEEPGWTWKKVLIIGNKLDLAEENSTAKTDLQALRDEYKDQVPVLGISAKNGTGLEDLRLKVFEVLDIIRVYTKTPGQKPDLNDPIVLERGSTLADAAEDVHKDFRAKLKFARLWGSGKHDGVMVKRDHVLEDGDVIELHI